jgi:hypothetical protein
VCIQAVFVEQIIGVYCQNNRDYLNEQNNTIIGIMPNNRPFLKRAKSSFKSWAIMIMRF